MLGERLAELERQLSKVSRLTRDNELPDATLTETGLKLTPQETAVLADAQRLIDQAVQFLPRIKITDLLIDMDDWTGFTRYFVHLKSEKPAKNRVLLLSAILADGINLELRKMTESCPGITYGRLSWLQAWPRIRRLLGRGHPILIRWPAFSRWWPWRKHGPYQS